MYKLFSFLQVFFIVLIIIYVYQINFQAPLFQGTNFIFVLSIFGCLIGIILATIIKSFNKLKDYYNPKINLKSK